MHDVLVVATAILTFLPGLHASLPISSGQQAKRALDPKGYCADKTTGNGTYMRHGWHGAALYQGPLGPELVIDGGELWINTTGTPNNLPANSTYSLPLYDSWRPEEVTISCIDKKDAPVRNRPNLWPDLNQNTSVYQFNGALSLAYLNPTTNLLPGASQVWQLSDQTWSLAGRPPIPQSADVAFTYGDGIAYFLAGKQSYATSQQIYQETNKSTSYIGTSAGLITFDGTTWTNRSIASYIPNGWLYDGNLNYVQGLGDGPLLVAMGGLTAYNNDPSTPTFLPYDFVGVYNPQTDEWRNQSTSGAIPKSRRRSCSVGVRGDNGTFEIFLYAGSSLEETNAGSEASAANIELDKVSVLSLPSFTWYETDYSPRGEAYARSVHSCHVAGQRQMLVVGGLAADVSERQMTVDPFPQGLGIFDMTDMEWRDRYDAGAAAYTTPRMIKDGIEENGDIPESWDDPLVATWVGKASNSTGDGGGGGGGGGGSGGGKKKSSSVVGPAVGGALGGVALLLLLGFGFWFYRRRSRKQQALSNQSSAHSLMPTTAKKEAPVPAYHDHVSDPKELGNKESRPELESHTNPNIPPPSEMQAEPPKQHGASRYEMQG